MSSDSESAFGSSAGESPHRTSTMGRPPGNVPPGWTIRGRWFVAPFVIVLCLLLAWTLAIAIQFQTIMTRLDQTRALWPAASNELALRFADFNAGLQSSNAAISDFDRKSWKEAYAAFRETSQYDRQSTHAATLERIREKAVEQGPGLGDTPALAKFLECERERIRSQQSIVGRWAITALRLKLPGTFSASE